MSREQLRRVVSRSEQTLGLVARGVLAQGLTTEGQGRTS